MKHLPLLLAAAALAGCAGSERPYSPVAHVRYSALGHDPFWSLAIGDDRIVLTRSGPGKRESWRSHSYPRVLPRTVDGARLWESGEGTAVISVEARPGPCTGSRGTRYEDHVRVRLSGSELTGCGGRILARGGR
jgi:uncharacterized membrane protein